MSRILFFTFLTITFSLFADPELFTEQTHYNFGKKPSGTLIEHIFMLENRGDENLKITDIKTSCGCTTPGNKTMLLKPGEKKALKVKMDLAGRSGMQAQHLTIISNDPEKRSHSLKITGEAVPDITVEPRTLNLKQQNMAKSHQGEIELKSTTGEPFEIVLVKAGRGRVESVVEHAEDGLSATVQVTAKPQDGEGHFTDVLEIETSNPEVRQMRVLVMWQISTGVSIAPGQVNLVLDDEPVAIDRYLMVRGYPGLSEPLKVTGVEWPGQDIEISVLETRKFGWRIHLKSFIPRADMKGGEILIHTNAEGFETLKVPVRLIEK